MSNHKNIVSGRMDYYYRNIRGPQTIDDNSDWFNDSDRRLDEDVRELSSRNTV